MGDIKQSASASATGQVGVVNVEGGLSFSLSPEFKTSGFIGSLLAPRRARKSAQAAKEINDAVAASMATYMALSPTVSPERAYLMAMTGLMFTERQTENLLAVLRSVAESTGGAADPSVIPSMARDKILSGSCEADDENARVMWAKLIAGEMRKPGTFSKKSMSILSEMNSEEAKLFEKLCSFCIELNVDLNNSNIEYYDPIVVLIHDDDASSYNNGSFSIMDINRLELLGLVSTNLSRTLSFHPNLQMPYRIGERVVLFACKGENEVKVRLDAVLTNYGTELSRLCDHGASQGAIDVLKKVAEKKGLTMKDAT